MAAPTLVYCGRRIGRNVVCRSDSAALGKRDTPARASDDPGCRAAAIVAPQRLSPARPTLAASASTQPGDDIDWQVVTVRAGQTVGDIFRQHGVSPGELQKLLDDRDNAGALRSIHPGDEFAFARAADDSMHSVRFDRNDHTRVIDTFAADGLHQSVQDREVERRTYVAHGVIERSLFDAGAQAGLSDPMVLKLANAFGYDIDFAQDLRQGDSFTVIYDDVYCEGEHLHTGDIIAATFINRGKRFSAFRYNGQYRHHNVLQRRRQASAQGISAHAGGIHPYLVNVQRGAPASCSRHHARASRRRLRGTVRHTDSRGRRRQGLYRGWQNGYGNVVILQHGGRYSTLYGHMSRFASIGVGQHVGQGQTIGYVGMTGMATGPHLHYEFRVDGVHRDPLTVTLPKTRASAAHRIRPLRTAKPANAGETEDAGSHATRACQVNCFQPDIDQ